MGAELSRDVDLHWVCDACGGAVGPEGVLHVDIFKAQDFVEAWAQFREETEGTIASPHQYPQTPRAPWLVHHDECAPEKVSEWYEIGLREVRTVGRLMERLADVLVKSWAPGAATPTLIRQLGASRQRAVRGLP